MNATSARATALQDKADLLRSLRLCVAEGIMAMPLVTMSLPVNVFMTALVTKAFPLPLTTIGLISALPFVANFLQLFAASFLARWRPPKTVTVTAATLHLGTWLALGVILPHVPRDHPAAAARWLGAWFFVSSALSAVAGVSWNAWIEEWVPARLRGKFFGRRNAALQVSTLSFLLVAGWALARWNYAVPAFQLVIAGAAFLRVFSLHWQWASPTREHRPSGLPPRPLARQAGIVLRARPFLCFVAFGAVWSFASNCFGPFYHVFMFDQVGFSALQVGIVSTLSQLGGALSLPAWGRWLDRHGNKPVMAISLALWQAQNLLWCFITPQNRALLYAMWLWGGVTSAGFVLGQFTLLLRVLPLEAKNLAIGVNLAVTSAFAAAAPVAGGWILARGLAAGGNPLAVYHACFVLQPVLALAGSALLLSIHEPQASRLTMVLGAMRNVRALSGALGLDFLTNYIFFKDPRRRRNR